MPSSSGPRNTAKDSLVFAMDTYDTSNCVTPLGCGGFNGSTQGIKNILTGATSLFQNGLRVSNRNFYTAFAIDYPESAYGGDAAGCQGISSGYNVRIGGNVYGASRALHLWVWNNDTNAWIEGYFRGARLGGHCYDNYSGAETGYNYELGLFVADFNIIKQAFPNCTYVVMGSHRADRYNSTVRDILWDLGMPAGYLESDYVAAPEWILVGKPGLGKGNAYGWSYENYSTNPSQVAHLNFSVTPKALGDLSFDGSDDYLNVGSSANFAMGIGNFTLEVMIYPQSFSNYIHMVALPLQSTFALKAEVNTGNIYYYDPSFTTYGSTSGWTLTLNQWNHVVLVRSGGTAYAYLNGVSRGSKPGFNTNMGTQEMNIGWGWGSEFTAKKINVVNLYNKALSATEIANNYRQYKTRFNLP